MGRCIPNQCAEVAMVCGHTNIYATSPPNFGELAWCHRCEEFKPVKFTRKIPAIPTPSTYSKSVQITLCYNDALLWRRR